MIELLFLILWIETIALGDTLNNSYAVPLCEASETVPLSDLQYELTSIQCSEELHEYHFDSQTRPYVFAKVAEDAEGNVGSSAISPFLFTSDEALLTVHRLRNYADAIVTGVNTIIRDNPRLTVRIPNTREKGKLRVILDSSLRLMRNSTVLMDPFPSMVVGCNYLKNDRLIQTQPATQTEHPTQVSPNKFLLLLSCNYDMHLSTDRLLAFLNNIGIRTVMLESGPRTLSWFSAENNIDAVVQIRSFHKKFGVARIPSGLHDILKQKEWTKAMELYRDSEAFAVWQRRDRLHPIWIQEITSKQQLTNFGEAKH